MITNMKTRLVLLLPAGLALALLIGATACRQSSLEHQRMLLDKYIVYWNTGNTDGVEAVLHPDYEMRYIPNFEPSVKGLEAFRKEMTRMRTLSFSVGVDEVVYGSDTITLRWTCSATFPVEGGGAPKSARAPGLSLLHIRDGKIADEWIAYDRQHWMEQLGFEMKPN
jgi:predicted ester cyclase